MNAFLARRRQRKLLKELIAHARGLRNMREDILPVADLAGLDGRLSAAQDARRSDDLARMQTAASALESCLSELAAKGRPGGGWRENFEVLVVALGVAMAFRCYFFQPFKIPTGSMQPTLYGIHSQEQRAPTLMDHLPLKVVKWAASGKWYREVRVVVGGQLVPLFGDDRKPGYQAFMVAGRRYYVPSDAVRERGVVPIGRDVRVPAGHVLWSGVVTSGDHVFVNRIAWNFRRPRRGEVMVFSTTGITELPQGTHYIKRMVGMPNETLSITPPDVLVGGHALTAPESIARIARKAQLAPWAPPYAGYAVIGAQESRHAHPLRRPGDSIALGPDEYYAMGDNTHNSRDSRYWGPVPGSNLLGPACLVYWPFTSPRFGTMR